MNNFLKKRKKRRLVWSKLVWNAIKYLMTMIEFSAILFIGVPRGGVINEYWIHNWVIRKQDAETNMSWKITRLPPLSPNSLNLKLFVLKLLRGFGSWLRPLGFVWWCPYSLIISLWSCLEKLIQLRKDNHLFLFYVFFGRSNWLYSHIELS